MDTTPEAPAVSGVPSFLEGGGELGGLMRAYDWSATPLGPPARWPRSLKTAVRIMLTSRQPIWLGWGPELTYLYNDPYKAIIGGKHPHALGRPFAEVWREIWDVVGPMADHVMQRDEGVYTEAQLLVMERHGYQEETYYTFSYSPIPDDEGKPGGLICANTDDTRRVIGERQIALLSELAARTAPARHWRDAATLALEALATNPKDIPFALLYLADAPQQTPTLAAASPGTASIAAIETWPWAAAIESQALRVMALDTLPRDLPRGTWPRPPSQAAVLPLAASGQGAHTGVLIVGLNPYRQFDDGYAGFLKLVERQVSGAIANAQAYEEERKRAEALVALDHAKTVFFSNVSHELRTPLTLLLGPLEEMVAEAGRFATDDQERLGVAHRNSVRLLKLVNTLLDFSRIEAGRIRGAYAATDLGTYTAELASQFRSTMERAHLEFIVDCRPLGAPVHVDRDMWEKIVFNLLSNAFKFTLEGEVEVKLRREGGHAVLTVRDTGTGIPAAELPHVFERFHRVEGARGRTIEGSGIGLALVQELVKLHGGAASVTSEPGRGSCFTIAIPFGTAHLPADHLEAAQPESTHVRGAAFVAEALSWLAPDGGSWNEMPAAPTRAAGPLARILVADDHADMREYLRRLIAERYEIETATDGEAALEAAHRRTPDLIVSDVMMPRLDGYGLLERVRADEKLRTVPVILLSAQAGEEARVSGMEAGADDYLVKPFNARELLARIGAHLGLSRLRRDVARVEQQLRSEAQSARERLETVLAGVNDQFYTFDHDWRYTLVNERVLQVTGRSRAELIGHTVWELFPQTLGSVFEREMRRAAESRRPAHFEYYFPPLRRWFENRVYPHENGISCFVTDVTDRKRAEAALRESEERFRTLADNMSQLAWMADREGRIFWYNRRWLEFTGATTEEMQRKGWAPLHHPEHADRVEARIRRSWTTGEQWEDTFPLRGADGGYRWFLARAVPIRDAQDAVVRWFGTHTDVTEQRAADEAIKEADRRKDEFLATLSHELRNPLAPLRNSLHLLRLAGDGNARTLPVYEMMERQVDHLVRLVDDLLEMSRISRGTFELRKEAVELAAVLRNAVETSGPLIEAHGHALSTHLPPEPFWLEGDPARLAQIFANLLNNAAKYTGAGGCIAIAARRDGGEVVVEICDNGAGMAPETISHMFEMFSRGNHASGRGQGGLGIGLALAQRLARMHGGSIEGRSDGPGHGSTFAVRLPLAAAAAATTETERPKAPLNQPRVLVVDDNSDAGDSLGMLLRFLGADVRIARDGPEALAEYEGYDPAVVLLDIGMPGMDGYEVARRIRARFPERHAALVALTGWGQESDRRRTREAGFDHHLIKPAEISALQALLESLGTSRAS